MFDSNRTLKLVFVTLSLRMKVLSFQKEWGSKKHKKMRRSIMWY